MASKGVLVRKKGTSLYESNFVNAGSIADARCIFLCRATGVMGRYKQWQYVSVVKIHKTKRKTVSEFDRNPQNYFRCPSRCSLSLYGLCITKENHMLCFGGTRVFKSGTVTWWCRWRWAFQLHPCDLSEVLGTGEGSALCPWLLWVTCMRGEKDKETNLFCMGRDL